MKAILLDGSLAGEVVHTDEMSAKLVVSTQRSEYDYYLLGMSSVLELVYVASLQAVVLQLLTLNARIKSPLHSSRLERAEIAAVINRSLLLPGRAIKILTGKSSGRATLAELKAGKIFTDELPIIPCMGIVIGWFLPGELSQIDTDNLALVVQFEGDSVLILEISKFQFLVGEIVEGKYANIKQQEDITLRY